MWHSWQASEIIKFLPYRSCFLCLMKSLTLEIGNTLKYFKENVPCLELYLKRPSEQHDSGAKWLSDANWPEIRQEHLINFWCEAYFTFFFFFFWKYWLCHQIGEILERLLQWRLEFSVLVTFYMLIPFVISYFVTIYCLFQLVLPVFSLLCTCCKPS